MKIRDVMTPHVHIISADDSLVEAAALMRELDVGVLPVCEEDRLIGMVTDRDVVIRAFAEGKDPATTQVREAMTSGLVYVHDDQDVHQAAHIMEEHQLRRLPVLDREKHLVGIVTVGDLALDADPHLSGEILKDIARRTPEF
jgi:CBS domain-containing protein